MSRLFKVTHKDGRPWTWSEMEDYAKDSGTMLVWCDVVGFMIDEYGNVHLVDSCGNYAPAPDDCKIVMRERGTCANRRREVFGDDYDDGVDDFECSECGEELLGNEPRYCPNCGRKVVR